MVEADADGNDNHGAESLMVGAAANATVEPSEPSQGGADTAQSGPPQSAPPPPSDPDTPKPTKPAPPATGEQAGSAAAAVVERPPLDVPVAPLPESIARTPCSVMTDGSPAVGEIAFVTFDFDGPFQLFRGTSVDIIGPSKRSALIEGLGDPSSVKDGQRFPFVIGGNMMWDKGFAVQTLLAGGEVKTRCSISDRRVPAPCRIITDGAPAKGERASVAYRLPGPYAPFKGQQTHIMGWGRKSVMTDGSPAVLRAGVKADFEIDGFMFKEGPFQVRTALADGAAHAVCEIS